jgi:signal transduction histidine kinase/DNA-binding response OmpR family regulator/putative methionine-R-sulfoxide reductase with GAF domain
MSTGKLRSRLESLFAEIDQETSPALEDGLKTPRGWTWECDAQGIYTTCSPEVESILGYPPEEFLGKPLTSSHLHPLSASRLSEALEAGQFPINLNLQFQFTKGRKTGLLPVNLHIFTPLDSIGVSGLRGFAQVNEKVGDGKVSPESKTEPEADVSTQKGLEQAPSREQDWQVAATALERSADYSGDLAQEPGAALPSPSPGGLTVPVRFQEQAKGLLEIIDEDPNRHWTEDERRLVEQVADQLSLALENARLFQAEQQRASELDKLVELSRLISQNLDLEEVYSTAHRIIGQLMPAEAFFINLLDSPGREFISSYGIDRGIRQPVERFPAGSGFSGYVAKTGGPYFARDLSADPPPYPRKPTPGSSQWVKSLIAVPLRFSGEIIGALSTQSYRADAFKNHDLKLLETFADHIAIAIQNARLFEQTQKTLAETEILYQASAELNTIQNYDDILNILCKSTVLGHHSVVHVAINTFVNPWDGGDPPPTFDQITSWSLNPAPGDLKVEVPPGGWEQVSKLLRKDEISTLLEESSPGILREALQVFSLEGMGAKCLLLTPFNVGGSWYGFLYAAFTQEIVVSEQEYRRLMALANQAAIAMQNLRLLEETQRRANQLETAAEIARHTSATLALDNLLKRAVTMICDRYGYYHASIYLVDSSEKYATLLASTGEAGEKMLQEKHQLPVGSRSIIGYVTESGEALVINDVSKDPIHRLNPLLPETRSELGIPLKIGTRVIGALNVQSDLVNGFKPEDTSVLHTLADQITVAVDNARSYEIAQQAIEESRQRVQELSVLFNTSQSLASASLESQEIANIVARRFLEVFKLPKCSLALLDAETEKLFTVVSLARGKNGAYQELFPTGEAGKPSPLQGLEEVEQVIHGLTPVTVRINDPHTSASLQVYMHEIGASLLVLLPLAVKGQSIGLIILEAWDTDTGFNLTQTTLAVTLANAAAAAVENARLYEEQISASEKLREVDKLKSQFLANMSHELRTPLNSIIGFSRVILKGIDGPVTELQQQDLNAIYSAGQHLLNLINDILDISKIEAGKMDLAFDDNINLAELIQSVLSTAVGLVKDKPIQLERIIPPDLPPVRADPTRLRQVILNLLSNAAKFTEQGTITIQVEIQPVNANRSEVIVKVIDTGIGIAPEDQKNLFQPFTQVDGSATRKTGGSGLGLSISRLLVEIHGGRIGVESAVGEGSCFYFTLPLDARPETRINEPGSRLVLAVEGEWQVLYLYDRYLSEHGYTVVPVSVPADAVARACELQPRAILLDVMLPGGNGWKILEELKQNPDTSHIPVIVCSLFEDRQRAFGLGASDYLLKPILEEDLIHSLQELEEQFSGATVLVIDDDPAELHKIERMLEQEPGFRAILAEGGTQGLLALRNQLPKAILLDFKMPGVDSLTLIETIRQEVRLAEVPLIVLAPDNLSEDETNRIDDLAYPVLHKGSFGDTELISSLKSILNVESRP